ncbi:hypothetical protein HPP92_027414 [Vanilla planifolia]|uniref:Protein kinase domain-containing protein n=1 Tax=Vanilla planifolia TaxID=51239 RepID=A0A835PA83_VANPL|nr:hypothetical protein HPP92_027414 [Vanilla planifolia]
MGMASIEARIRLLMLLSTVVYGMVAALNEEGFALLSVKGFIKEDPEGALSNWNSSEEDPCLWNGVACREGRVVSVSLPKAELSGTISPSLGSLPYLRHINLRNNRFSGNLHSGLFSAQGIQSLVLYGNLLSGTLPPEIGNLSFLQILDLSDNLLNGSIPTSLLRCRKLRVLVLSHNNLTGTLPFSFGVSFAALENLDLSFNRLNGSIPGDIGVLSNLQGTVDLSHNLFAGLIPTSLGNLSERVYIDLSYNNLCGPIPKNGTLVNRGPAAFTGNPCLCGPPLKNPCFSSVAPTTPSSALGGNSSTSNVSYVRKLKRRVVTAIVLGDVAAICVIGMVFYCFYQRAVSSKRKEEESRLGKASKRSKGCLCFMKDGEGKLSKNMEQIDLIPLDKQIYFDLDELLKASAVVLGKSGLGIVYKVVLEDGLTLAVRRLGEGGSQRFKEFQREVEDIGRIRHPNIVSLRAYYWSFEEKLLIYDYIPGGNLSAAIHGEVGVLDFSPLPWDLRAKIMLGVAKGLAYLHELSPKKYVHGDIKPNNILLGLDMEPHLSDFGVGRLADMSSNRTNSMKSQSSDSTLSPTLSSRLCYRAPEALKGMKPSQKWDVYSYGVVLLELISGRSPAIMLDTLQMDIVRWVHLCIEERKPLVDVLDPLLAQEPDKEDQIIAVLKIALACVQPSPERRPHMRSVTESLQRSVAD